MFENIRFGEMRNIPERSFLRQARCLFILRPSSGKPKEQRGKTALISKGNCSQIQTDSCVPCILSIDRIANNVRKKVLSVMSYCGKKWFYHTVNTWIQKKIPTFKVSKFQLASVLLNTNMKAIFYHHVQIFLNFMTKF